MKLAILLLAALLLSGCTVYRGNLALNDAPEPPCWVTAE